MKHIVQVPQGPIEYRLAGQGVPVLVLNGGHTHCQSPLGNERFFLAHGYQFIVPSRPGYGRTPSSSGRTAEESADALASLLDCLRLAQVIVVGISGGGPTALQLASRPPKRVSRLILQNAVTGGVFRSRALRLGRSLSSTVGWRAPPGPHFVPWWRPALPLSDLVRAYDVTLVRRAAQCQATPRIRLDSRVALGVQVGTFELMPGAACA